MKKLLIPIFLVMVSMANAQLKTRAAFDYFSTGNRLIMSQSSRTPSGVESTESIINIMEYGSFRVRTGADYTIKRFTAYFDQSVYMKLSKTSFSPLQAEWYVGVKYNITSKINLQVEHLCIHPVSPRLLGQGVRLYGGYNMISINYGY